MMVITQQRMKNKTGDGGRYTKGLLSLSFFFLVLDKNWSSATVGLPTGIPSSITWTRKYDQLRIGSPAYEAHGIEGGTGRLSILGRPASAI
jgi:hypothetical protein